MGRIKSALEIAMERTEGVQGDKASIGLFEAKQRGKRLANQFLSGDESPGTAEAAGGDISFEAIIKKAPREEQESLRQGCFEVLLSQITLPQTPEDIKRIEKVGKGLSQILSSRRFTQLYQQFNSAMNQYLDEAAQYEEAIKRQYAPKLRQKEEELARRLGRHIKLDPFQDPEFVAFYNQNMNALKGNYEAMISQVQEQVRLLFQGEA
jgi:hypothetical protein